MMELENEAKRRAAAHGQARVIETTRFFTLDAVAACGGALKKANDIEQRALA